MNDRKVVPLFFSILTACMTGGLIALSGILVFNYVKSDILSIKVNAQANASAIQAMESKSPIEDIDSSILEEGEEDPSFTSRFSRVFIYSADDGREVIQSAKSSIPITGKDTISAPAYVVMDMDRKTIVLEKNSETLFPIASVTKLVTAVIAKKLFINNDLITITSQALATYGNEGRLREGEKFTVNELLYPLLMVSSNDSAEVLAQAYGRKEFIKEMNDWVNSIGAYRTYFADPTGLSSKNVSTAKDLSIITKWILDNEPEIFNITLEKSKIIRTHTWTNPTHFLNLDSYFGGKNGYTPEANRTSVSLFKLGRQRRLYSVMLLGSSSRDSDVLDLLEEAVR